MAIGGEKSGDVGGTIGRLQEQRDTAVRRATGLHRSGASEEAVLAETAVAVGAARALEILTGESWESQLERQEVAAARVTPDQDAQRSRFGRRKDH